GTVHASLADYARFLRVFLNDGGGWLGADSVARLTRPAEGEGRSYALGWGVTPVLPWTGGAPALAHDGSNTLWLARAVVIPARRRAITCVANAGVPAEPAIDALTGAMIQSLPG